MIRRFLRSAPKYFIALAIVVASVVTLVVWKFWRGGRGGDGTAGSRPASAETVKIREPAIEGREGRLLLVDNDLYDVDSGELLAKGWLNKPMPRKLYHDPKTKKFIGHYERGFGRFGLNGVADGDIGDRSNPAFSDDLKWMLFARGRDLWRADIDWTAFKRVNERKVTAIEQFNDMNFAENIVLGSEKTLVVRNGIKLLHVNLETGDVKPCRMNLGDIRKRRSPDSRSVVGLEKNQFYCYDVDSNEAKVVPVNGRGVMNDCQWLGNDRCVVLAVGTALLDYDRPGNKLAHLATLPFPCAKVGLPSPDNRFVFCVGNGKGAVLDVKKKTATTVTGGAGLCWVSNDTFAFSREVPDSNLRGTWLQTVGEGERRVSPDPYLVGNAGPHLQLLKSPGVVLFSTKHGLSKMKPDGTEVEKFGKMNHPPERALGIQEWKMESAQVSNALGE